MAYLHRKAAKNVFMGMTDYTSEIHITGYKKGEDNNNMMERLNGTIRDREKTFRGLGTKYTANFHGLRLHYNHIRKHQALGQTLAEKAGIHKGFKQMGIHDLKW